MAFNYKPSGFNRFASSLTVDPNLKYASGGGLAAGLLAGLKGYGDVSGSIEKQKQQDEYNTAMAGINPLIAQGKFAEASAIATPLDTEYGTTLAQKQAEMNFQRDQEARKLQGTLAMAAGQAGVAPSGYRGPDIVSTQGNYSGGLGQKGLNKLDTKTGEIRSDLVKKEQELKQSINLGSAVEDTLKSQGILQNFDKSIGSIDKWSKMTQREREMATGLQKLGAFSGGDPEEASARQGFQAAKEQITLDVKQQLAGLGVNTPEELEQVAKGMMQTQNPYDLVNYLKTSAIIKRAQIGNQQMSGSQERYINPQPQQSAQHVKSKYRVEVIQ